MSDLHSFSFFDTILYKAELPEYLKDKNFMNVCDEHTDQAISNTKKLIVVVKLIILCKRTVKFFNDL